MTYALRCGDVVPGCDVAFEAESEDALLYAVTQHAQQDHPDIDLDAATVREVKAAIQTR